MNGMNNYRETYGEDNTEYLMEMEQGWFKEYSKAVFIDWNCLGNTDFYRSYTKKCAEYLNWEFQELVVDTSFMERLLSGRLRLQ